MEAAVDFASVWFKRRVMMNSPVNFVFRFSAMALSMLLLLPGKTFAAGMMDGQGMGMGMMQGQGMGMMGGASARHRYVMRNGLGSQYAGKTNPLPATAENINAGKALYGQYCTACHGVEGHGDGAAATSLVPPPSDLARLVRMPIATDDFLYWSIAEGGAQFNTAMPAMKGSLKEADIWKIILYLRNF
jgi:mono/diheme cytochrome c family protein